MIDKVKPDCVGCMSCVNECPKKCIIITTESDGFLYPKVYKETCINCKKCLNICPALSNDTLLNDVKNVYAAKHKDRELLVSSQSGGVSFALGKYIIENKGIVYGCILNNNLKVIHSRCENIKELEKTRGSKYSQSFVNPDLYNNIKNDLINKKKVLFIGTPCQCMAVKKKFSDYDNLYLVDLICHGVTSPALLEKYISEKQKKYKNKGKIINIDFRDKKHFKWLTSINRLDFSDGSNINLKDYREIYGSYIFCRLSCYKCLFANRKRVGDLTIGDFHGIKKYMPNMYDEKGVSICCINSEKGNNLFIDIKDNFIYKSTDIDTVCQTNYCFENKIIINKNRTNHIRNINFFGFDIYSKYMLLIYKINRLKNKMITIYINK